MLKLFTVPLKIIRDIIHLLDPIIATCIYTLFAHGLAWLVGNFGLLIGWIGGWSIDWFFHAQINTGWYWLMVFQFVTLFIFLVYGSVVWHKLKKLQQIYQTGTPVAG